MLHVFSINPVKLVTRKPKTTVILGRMEYSFIHETLAPLVKKRDVVSILSELFLGTCTLCPPINILLIIAIIMFA
jgi:hypothetical protein